MSIVTFFSGTHCHGAAIAQQTARELGYELVDREILEAASERYSMPYDKLLRAMQGPISIFNNVTHERERCVAYIQAAFADYLKNDNFVYHGYAAHLLPKTLSHILRICIVADHDYRIENAVKSEGLTDKKAAQQLDRDDEVCCQWTQYLFDTGPWNERLYDIKIPMHTMSIDQAVALIRENVEKESLRTTPDSQRVVEDFIAASQVNVALIEKGYNLDVSCVDGRIIITIDKFTWRFERMKKKVSDLAQTVPGVTDVDVRKGPHFERPRISPLDFEVPSQVLLVDDEKEFVLTLSERLKMRKIPSQVVYDGGNGSLLRQGRRTGRDGSRFENAGHPGRGRAP